MSYVTRYWPHEPMSSFLGELEADLSWREQELAAMKLVAVGAEVGSPRQRAMLRALVALLYAHYEGFCKFCWESYADGVCANQIAPFKLQDSIRAEVLSAQIKKIKTGMSRQEVADYLERYSRQRRAPKRFTIEVDTEANLSPEHFERIMAIFNLRCDPILDYRTEIKTLVVGEMELHMAKS